MGVAALGLMMGQMQEANKDDYNMGAMLHQLSGTLSGEQSEANSSMNSPVGSVINYMSGTGGGAAPQNAGQFGPGGGGSGGGLGGLIQQLMAPQSPQDSMVKQAQNPTFNPQEVEKRKNAYDTSGSATNWSY